MLKAVAALIINIINIYCVKEYFMKKIRSFLASLLCCQPRLNPERQFTAVIRTAKAELLYQMRL